MKDPLAITDNCDICGDQTVYIYLYKTTMKTCLILLYLVPCALYYTKE